ncbi:MAG: hypothetical protein QRY71_05710 [Candidatus Rhabdochlamydia sp.]
MTIRPRGTMDTEGVSPSFSSKELFMSASSSEHQEFKRLKTEAEETIDMTSSKITATSQTFFKTEAHENIEKLDPQNIDHYIDFFKSASPLATAPFKGKNLSAQQFYIQFLKEYPHHLKAYKELRSLLTEFCCEDPVSLDEVSSEEDTSSDTDVENSLSVDASSSEEDASSDISSHEVSSSDEEEHSHSL